MAESKDGLVHSLVSAFHNLANLMKAPVGDVGAIANAKSVATGLSGLHPDVVAAYHDALVAAVTVQPVPVIPMVEPLVSHNVAEKSEDSGKYDDIYDMQSNEPSKPEGGARVA